MHSIHRSFSHIYLEKAAKHDRLAQEILQKFPNSNLIEIDSYKEIFNRKRQDWRLQKAAPKLILARKKDDFLYPGSRFTPSFDNYNFFYNTLMMNCIYDCHYCYLQGMYPSANVVCFTNLEDYFTATDQYLSRHSQIYLSISYDTDLLAFEGLFPYTARWIEYASGKKNLLIEVRTKSANFKAIQEYEPQKNIILAWTLSPQTVIERYETKTPSLKARLSSIQEALSCGWPVRLCFDPMLIFDGWEDAYSELFATVRKEIDLSRVKDISIGTFRMNSDFYKELREARTDSDLVHFPFQQKAGTVGYNEENRQNLLNFARSQLLETIPAERIYFS